VSGFTRRYRITIAVLVVAFAGSVLLSVALGAVSISPADSIRLIAWKLHLISRPHVPEYEAVILFQLRLPRVLLASVVGAALATAGTVFQGLFRNPMADPAIIGVSSGAALGAILVMVAGAGAAAGGLAVPAAAFAGALVTALVVYRLARIGPALHVATLLLAGVAIAALISSVISVVMSLSGEQIRNIYFWLLGGLGARGWQSLEAASPLVVFGVGTALLLVGDLNLMALGE
jgi:iron complex transport system permease protein